MDLLRLSRESRISTSNEEVTTASFQILSQSSDRAAIRSYIHSDVLNIASFISKAGPNKRNTVGMKQTELFRVETSGILSEPKQTNPLEIKQKFPLL
jgi:hypothetical protein